MEFLSKGKKLDAELVQPVDHQRTLNSRVLAVGIANQHQTVRGIKQFQRNVPLKSNFQEQCVLEAKRHQKVPRAKQFQRNLPLERKLRKNPAPAGATPPRGSWMIEALTSGCLAFVQRQTRRLYKNRLRHKMLAETAI